MQQGDRRAGGGPDHEYARAMNPGHVFAPRDALQLFIRDIIAIDALIDLRPTDLPRVHDRKDERADCQREPAALVNFVRVGAEEREVDDEKKTTDRHGHPQRTTPLPTR